MKLFSVVFLVLLLLVATTEMGPVLVDGARMCGSQSYRYKGPCMNKSNCANVCLAEGFRSGYCRGGFFGRCICRKSCW